MKDGSCRLVAEMGLNLEKFDGIPRVQLGIRVSAMVGVILGAFAARARPQKLKTAFIIFLSFTIDA